jgi:hypothetical protein
VAELRQPGLDPESLGAAGGGFGAAQQTGSALPGAGQQEQFADKLRQPGLDPESLGAAGGGFGAAQETGSALPTILQLGNRSSLGYCYWKCGLLAREQGDRSMEREKLAAALIIFTDLKMPRERDAVRAEMEKPTAADSAI